MTGITRIKSEDLELFRWPIDICVLSLAFCYGLTKLLVALWPDSVPAWSKLLAYAITTFVSTLLVRRYMPSDVRLEPRAGWVVVTWIQLSLILSTVIPVIGIFYVGSPLFWFLMIGSSALKAVHALESAHRKNIGEPSTPAALPRHSQFIVWAERRRSVFEYFMFEVIPDAYALRPFPTAILLTGGASCEVIAYIIAPELERPFFDLAILFIIAYIILSTMARVRAIHLTAQFAAEQRSRGNETQAVHHERN